MHDNHTPVVVITGASSGIGRATALAFAQQGVNLVLAARTRSELEAIAARTARIGSRTTVVPTDVANEDEVHRLASIVLEEHGRVTTWVNAAGITPRMPLTDTTTSAIEQAMAVNFYGAVHGIRAAIDAMRPTGSGTIITIGSLTCIRGAPHRAAYSASKHALKGYIESARIELRRSVPGITLTLVHPGSVATSTPLPGRRHRFAQRPHTPDVVAQAVVFAASHPRRDIYVGTGRGLAAVEGLCPSLLDWIYERAVSTPEATPKTSAPEDDDVLATSGVRTRSVVTSIFEYHPHRYAMSGVVASGLLAMLARRLLRARG
jgi:NAD(P)-dependent dehydrogenase (short-subunit alcohol dehydrogenase family)